MADYPTVEPDQADKVRDTTARLAEAVEAAFVWIPLPAVKARLRAAFAEHRDALEGQQ